MNFGGFNFNQSEVAAIVYLCDFEENLKLAVRPLHCTPSKEDVMQCLPRIALSPSAVAVQQVRSLRLLPSLLSEASSSNGASAQTQSSDVKPSYDTVIAGAGPVSTALACSIGKEEGQMIFFY
jgi:hypothetical protein